MTKGRSVLIVDDDPHIRRLISLYLRGDGWDITEASSGEEGQEILASREFDLVLIDLILPYYSGTRLCRKCKEGRSGGGQVVIMTADDSEETRQLAKSCGADAFLAKPFTADDLFEVVRERVRSNAS